MRVVLYTKPSPIEFTTSGDTGPYPFVNKVGDLVQAARAGDDSGIGVGESANLSVVLDNPKQRVSGLIGRPLRVRADVFDDADGLYFGGLVTNIKYGPQVELLLEA